MSDLRLLAFVLQRRFSVPRRIWLGGDYGLVCCCLAWSFCWFLLFWRVFP